MEESRAAALDASVPATPAPSDTKPPETAASAPPPPPAAEIKPVDLPPQTIPITDAVRETDSITNVTQVPNLMADSKSKDEQEVFYRLRLGYDHTQFGRGGDTWHLGAQFNVRPKAWFEQSAGGMSAFAKVVVPDITAEIGHTGMGTTINKTPTTGDGVRADMSLFWPWLNWTKGMAAGDSSPQSAASKANFALGPTVYGSFQELTSVDDSRPDWERYAGARFMYNHDAFVEYTFGKTDTLPGWRHQITAEFPIYQKEGSELRYVVRGIWNTAYNTQKDVYGISLLVEFPLDTLEHPSKFRDLVPFVK